MLDGDTNENVDLTGKRTSFDISRLPTEGPSSRVGRAIDTQWALGRQRTS